MSSAKMLTFSQKEEELVRLMQLLGDKTRFQIFKLIASNDTLCVSEIATTLGLSVSAISQHFKLFEEIGVVSRVRFGQKICYRILPDTQASSLLKHITKENENE